MHYKFEQDVGEMKKGEKAKEILRSERRLDLPAIPEWIYALALQAGLISEVKEGEEKVKQCECGKPYHCSCDYNETKPEPPQTEWRPERGHYFFIMETLEVNEVGWTKCPYDLNLFRAGNCFATRELAEQARDKMKELLTQARKI